MLFEEIKLNENTRSSVTAQFIQINNGNRTEWSPIRSVIIRVIREITFDVKWSYVKQQTAKMKLLPSVLRSLNSKVKIFVFVAISRRHFSIFV